MRSLLEQMRVSGYPPGAQRAFIIAKVLEKIDIIVVGSKTPDLIRQVHMIPADDMESAFRISAQKIGRKHLDALIVPHAMLTLPIIS